MEKQKRFSHTKKDILDNKLFFKFQQKYPEHRERGFAEFEDALRMFHKTLYQMVVEYRDGVELPESLGCIFLGSCWAPKKKNVDFNKTKKYGKVIYHTNTETDGYLAKIFYTNYNNKYSFQNRELWQFEAIRQFRKLVADTYPEEWRKYIVVDPTLKVNKLFNSKLNIAKRKKRNEYQKEDYNEFDFKFDQS